MMQNAVLVYRDECILLNKKENTDKKLYIANAYALQSRRNIVSIIYPLTARVVGAPQIICNQFPPFSPVLYCPLGLGKLQACPFPDVVFRLLPLSALSSFPFHCALQDGFGQT